MGSVVAVSRLVYKLWGNSRSLPRLHFSNVSRAVAPSARRILTPLALKAWYAGLPIYRVMTTSGLSWRISSHLCPRPWITSSFLYTSSSPPSVATKKNGASPNSSEIGESSPFGLVHRD
jgi:hypothetical protein